MDTRATTRETKKAELDRKNYENQQLDESKDSATIKRNNAEIEGTQAQINELNTNDSDANRLMQQYEFQATQVRNQYRITQAQLEANIKNAELIVQLNLNSNMKGAVELNESAIETLNANVAGSNDQTAIDAWNLEITQKTNINLGLNRQIEASNELLAEMQVQLTTVNAYALSIGSVIATEEANLRLATATKDFDDLTRRKKET